MKSKKKQDREKLALWQERLKKNESAYAAELAKMDEREAKYAGDRTLRQVVDRDYKKQAVHVRNVCAELVEAQVSSNIPKPKVTARREGDEEKAKLIEDMLRNELDRMPFEMLNDQMERTVPIQGGGAYLVEWDNTRRTHTTIGELTVSHLHPKQIIPQDGVFTGIEDMDYIILRLPQTKEYLKRRYGVDLCDERETEPSVKGSGDTRTAEDMVTQYIAYYRNEDSGIGLFSWVGDTILEDLEDYQARRLRRCATCGAVEPAWEDEAAGREEDTSSDLAALGHLPLEGKAFQAVGDAGPYNDLIGDRGMPGASLRPTEESREVPVSMRREGRKHCPYCGGTKWEESPEEYEELYAPVQRSDGSVIGAEVVMNPVSGQEPELELVSEPVRIPFYKPDIFPIILQKNVSVFGKFLGDSDIDKIADQQNTINRIEGKIIDKLMKSGSYITLPDEASIRADPEEMKVIRPGNAASKAMIDVYDLEGNIVSDMNYLAQVYEEARQIIGITDSFQGRRDTTATSGKAREFAAAQSAGRLESKRVMKDAAYAALFEAMFKFKLAYTDEPRPVVADDIHGNKEYKSFNRYDFLEQDAAGEWYWNDQFLFSCDTSAPLASNREAMWQETRMNLQTGAFGDPTQIQTLILFWTKMEMLHYPGAGETRSYLEEELQRQQAQQQMMMQMQAMQQQAQQQRQMQAQADQQAAQGTVRQAQADARRDALAGMAPGLPGM